MSDMEHELISAFGLNIEHLEEDISNIVKKLKYSRLFKWIEKAVYSNRTPATIMKLASEVGMIIPVKYRVGIKTYNYFMTNILQYNNTMEEGLNIKDVIASNDRKQLIAKFKDQEIMNVFGKHRTFTSREDLLLSIEQYQLYELGRFEIEGSKKCIDKKTIRWKLQDKESFFTFTELLTDIRKGRYNAESIYQVRSLIQRTSEHVSWKLLCGDYFSGMISNLDRLLEKKLEHNKKSLI